MCFLKVSKGSTGTFLSIPVGHAHNYHTPIFIETLVQNSLSNGTELLCSLLDLPCSHGYPSRGAPLARRAARSAFSLLVGVCRHRVLFFRVLAIGPGPPPTPRRLLGRSHCSSDVSQSHARLSCVHAPRGAPTWPAVALASRTGSGHWHGAAPVAVPAAIHVIIQDAKQRASSSASGASAATLGKHRTPVPAPHAHSSQLRPCVLCAAICPLALSERADAVSGLPLAATGSGKLKRP